MPLVKALRLNAAYVQGRPGLVLSTLLSSGFLANSTNHAQAELDTPVLQSIDNGSSGQLIAHLLSVANAHSYQVNVMSPDGKLVKMVDSTQARNVVLPGLIPGVVYTLVGRAVGGTTGYSGWSDPVSPTWQCECSWIEKRNKPGRNKKLFRRFFILF